VCAVLRFEDGKRKNKPPKQLLLGGGGGGGRTGTGRGGGKKKKSWGFESLQARITAPMEIIPAEKESKEEKEKKERRRGRRGRDEPHRLSLNHFSGSCVLRRWHSWRGIKVRKKRKKKRLPEHWGKQSLPPAPRIRWPGDEGKKGKEGEKKRGDSTRLRYSTNDLTGSRYREREQEEKKRKRVNLIFAL